MSTSGTAAHTPGGFPSWPLQRATASWYAVGCYHNETHMALVAGWVVAA
jgi:hypothetical protein